MAIRMVGSTVTETKNQLCSANSAHENRRWTIAPRRRPHGIAEHGEEVPEDRECGDHLATDPLELLEIPNRGAGVRQLPPVVADHQLLAPASTRGLDESTP